MKKHMTQYVALTVAALVTLLSACGSPNNQQAAITGSSATGGCIPINQQIPFTAVNAYVGSGMIVAGSLNQNQPSIGTVTLGGNIPGGSIGKQNANGSSISMNSSLNSQVNSGLPGSSYNNGGNATLTGVITLGAQDQQQIINQLQGVFSNNQYGSNGYNNSVPGQNNNYANGTSACISSLAMQLSYTQSYYGAGPQVSGVIYAYLNNSPYLMVPIQF